MKIRPRVRHEAFTMVELLVAIAVIGVLVALLLPAMAGARDRAETATCSQNLKQIGTSVLAFAGEHNGLCPTAGAVVPKGATDPNTGKPGWTEQIVTYIGEDTKVFRCPASARVLSYNAKYSYFLGARAAYVDAGDSFAALNLYRIQSPSRYILGGDITANLFTADDADKDDYAQNPFAAKPAFHAGKPNILFADGSVRQVAGFDAQTMEITYSGTGAEYP